MGALTAACGGNDKDPILGGGSAALAPTVVSVTPAPSATGVPLATPAISATFDQPVAAITGGATFALACTAPCTAPGGTVTLDSTSKVATFTLAAGSSLLPLTSYTAAVSGARSASTGLVMASPFRWTFTTQAETTRPMVTATAPVTSAPAATGVPITSAIVAAFTEDMNAATITAPGTFRVTCAAPCVSPPGSVTYTAGSKAATFTPSASLSPGTLYTATITTAATDVAGNALAGNTGTLPAASDYLWTFTTGSTTDTTRPTVTVTAPLTSTPGPVGVAANTTIVATFSESMSPATILSTGAFTVTCAAPCVSPAGTVAYVPGSRTATFTPAAALAAGTTYTAAITTAATDLAGNALAGNQAPLPGASNHVWTFTTTVAPPAPAANVTVFSTSPTANAVNVCPRSTVSATFSVPSGQRMDPGSLNSATFKVTGPAPASTPVVAASVVLDPATGRVATFVPQSPLVDGVTYTATIVGGGAGVKDLAVPGNVMASNFTWSFTAGPATGICLTPPTLGSAAPFGIFGGSAGMTNSGINTVINGDIGTIATGTSSITGFHDTAADIYTESPSDIGTVNGKIYSCTNSTTGPTSTGPNAASCTAATQARLDAEAAYLALVALPPGPYPGGNLAGLTLAPGVYTSAPGSFLMQGGNLTLDAQGDANAVWVFQMATTLTVGGPGAAAPQSVILINGAQAGNVFWQVGTAATINAGGGGTMVGTIISQDGTSFSTAGNAAISTLEGRALSLNASITVVNTTISVPGP